jgi:hypothetical protein
LYSAHWDLLFKAQPVKPVTDEPKLKDAQSALQHSQGKLLPCCCSTPASESPKLGRPKTGKRSTYAEVRLRLFVQEGGREFSDLVQTLPEHWLKSPK